jgi:DnaK suppressor protein
VKATAQTQSKPAAKPAAKAAKTSAKAKTKPVVKKAVVKPAAKQAAPKPVAKPAAKKPVFKAAVKPAAKKPVSKAAAKPAAKKPVAKAAAKPAAKKPVPQKPAAKPASQPVAKKPAVKPAAKPVAPKPAAQTAPPPTAAKPAKVDVKPVVQTAAPKTETEPGRKLTGRAAKAAAGVPPPPSTVSFSNAAKASFGPATESRMPTLVPVIPKKDAKLANNWKSTPVEKLSDAEVLAMPDAEYMNDTQLAFFRLKLLQLKRDILNSAGQTTEHLREDTVIVPDPADRATIEEEHALELRTRDRERKLLKKIEQSIQRIDMGDYGYCDETGEPIGVARLLARPTATLSLEAQQRRELKQKMFGD